MQTQTLRSFRITQFSKQKNSITYNNITSHIYLKEISFRREITSQNSFKLIKLVSADFPWNCFKCWSRFVFLILLLTETTQEKEHEIYETQRRWSTVTEPMLNLEDWLWDRLILKMFYNIRVFRGDAETSFCVVMLLHTYRYIFKLVVKHIILNKYTIECFDENDLILLLSTFWGKIAIFLLLACHFYHII